ncbi:hypothetical protein M0R72_19630 [Candidatus Pacearchaeota archaeon]|jgi:endo-1,4-beta-D-glucanase Y|nr:hypothetical protein [Candidatus Pacearchaeota archaeon]
MSILSEVRQLLAETDQKIRDPTLTATETAWAAINFADKMSVMLPEVLAYAEMRDAALVEERCKVIMLIEKLKRVANDPDWQSKGMEHDYDWYMREAAKELSADLPPRITEEEKEAIENTMVVLMDYGANCEVQIGDVAPLIEVLRGLL